MNKQNVTATLTLFLTAVFVCFALIFQAAAQETSEDEQRQAEVKEQMQLEQKVEQLKEKAEQAEKLRQKKEQAEKEKREKAELERQKAEAKAKARAEAEKLAQLDAEAKAQAEAEIAQAKTERDDALAKLKADYDNRINQVCEQIKQLKDQYEQDKASLKTQYKDKIAQAEKAEKESLKAELDEKLIALRAQFERQLDQLTEQKQQLEDEYSQKKTIIEEDYATKVAIAKARQKRAMAIARLGAVNLPEDNTPRLNVKQIKLSGNILVGTDEIINKLPIIYNASDKPLDQADPMDLYDFRVLGEILLEPGEVRQISARTIQGFTQFILSLYQEHNYAGIYVYVPKSAMESPNKLVDDILLIEVLEAPVTDITVRMYDPDQNEKEKGYLRKSAIMDWSPLKPGEVANQKELDDFVNLLNLNPDRYVSAVVTKGAKPNTLSVEYDIYEANPWHWFIQLDNSGTRDRQWVPRMGLINTNLLGVDDTFALVYQAPWESTFDDEYSIFGSYDIPIAGPKLRFNVYAGYSQYDINPDAGPFNFIGNGNFVGGILRYNALQTEPKTPILGDGWFVDLKGMIEYTRTKVTPSLFPQYLGSDVRFWLWGWGIELHKRDDMSEASFGFDYWKSGGGQSNAATFATARANAESTFSIYDFYSRCSLFVDPNKIHRISGTFRWIGANERLVPAKMTSFGGMYTVRGYDEYELVADGGILASFQYEYDLIAAEKANAPEQQAEQAQQQEQENPWAIKRAAPLVFVDYGRTTVRHPISTIGEVRHEELCSVGIGALLDIGDHFSGAVYYGYPLIPTAGTRSGKGRVNTSFMLRW